MKVSCPGSCSVCVCVWFSLVQAELSGFKARAPVLCVGVSGLGRPPLSTPAYLWPEPACSNSQRQTGEEGSSAYITPVHSYAHRTWSSHICVKHTVTLLIRRWEYLPWSHIRNWLPAIGLTFLCLFLSLSCDHCQHLFRGHGSPLQVEDLPKITGWHWMLFLKAFLPNPLQQECCSAFKDTQWSYSYTLCVSSSPNKCIKCISVLIKHLQSWNFGASAVYIHVSWLASLRAFCTPSATFHTNCRSVA